jgi:hypothetical protein
MANDTPTYEEQIAQLRAERHQREARKRLKVVEDNWKVAVGYRQEAEEASDLGEWDSNDQWAEELEREYAELQPKQPQQPDYLTPENVQHVQRCGDLVNPVNNLKFEQCMATARSAGVNLADPAQFREAVEKFISPGIFDKDGRLVPGTEGPIVPVGYEPMPDRNEAFELARNSKYAGDLKPEEYIRGEQERDKRKNLGYYRDNK